MITMEKDQCKLLFGERFADAVEYEDDCPCVDQDYERLVV